MIEVINKSKNTYFLYDDDNGKNITIKPSMTVLISDKLYKKIDKLADIILLATHNVAPTAKSINEIVAKPADKPANKSLNEPIEKSVNDANVIARGKPSKSAKESNKPAKDEQKGMVKNQAKDNDVSAGIEEGNGNVNNDVNVNSDSNSNGNV
jgi:hypothetical protein